MLKEWKDKTSMERKNKYKAYCPIIDMVIEAKDKEDRDKKVQKEIARRREGK